MSEDIPGKSNVVYRCTLAICGCTYETCRISHRGPQLGQCKPRLTDRFKEPGLCWCWNCVDRLVWGYRVSCLMASVNANRFLLIDVFTKESRVYAMGLGLIGDPVRLRNACVPTDKREVQ